MNKMRTTFRRPVYLGLAGLFLVVGTAGFGLAIHPDPIVRLLKETSLIQSAHADNHDGDPTLCDRDHDWGSSGSGPVGELNIRSRCNSLDPATMAEIGASNEDAATFLLQTEADLWSTGRLPRVLYHYVLEIDNDGPEDIELNLGDWNVTHSPYTWVAESFAYQIPACSRFVLKFYAPWAPEIQNAAINIGLRNEDGTWGTIGAGASSIVTPVWFQYFAEGKGIIPLTSEEAHTEECQIVQ
jgi:hypothetical protein